VEQARAMLIAAAREMIAAYRQLKASLRYSRKAKAVEHVRQRLVGTMNTRVSAGKLVVDSLGESAYAASRGLASGVVQLGSARHPGRKEGDQAHQARSELLELDTRSGRDAKSGGDPPSHFRFRINLEH
jgi:hypothetical protein